MANIIDRRSERRKSSPNRERLLRRIKDSVKKAIPTIVDQNSIRDLGEGGKGIAIPVKGLGEPTLHHDEALGQRYRVFTGNDQFVPGDKIEKPLTDGGKGSAGSNDPTITEDDFVIYLTREEFIDFFFNDLELPYLIKKQQSNSIEEFRMRHAGHITDGIPARLEVIRSWIKSYGRKLAVRTSLEEELKRLNKLLEEATTDDERKKLQEEIEEAQLRLDTIPYFHDVDLRYKHFVKEPIPITRAVMFCLMDVSGSMTQEEKDIAKRFYMLLYLFLESQYKHVDIVWIRHHTEAQRVDEEEFFGSRESGGTVVSSALKLALDIIKNGDDKSPGGYPTNQWNIYFAQCTDGDNYPNDPCQDIINTIMRYTQYYAYIQINCPEEQNLWKELAPIAEQTDSFQMRHINDKKEIWEVFKALFQKKSAKSAA